MPQAANRPPLGRGKQRQSEKARIGKVSLFSDPAVVIEMQDLLRIIAIEATTADSGTSQTLVAERATIV